MIIKVQSWRRFVSSSSPEPPGEFWSSLHVAVTNTLLGSDGLVTELELCHPRPLITSTIVTSSTINTCQHSPVLHNITSVTPHQQRRLGSFLIYCLCLLLSKYNRITQ